MVVALRTFGDKLQVYIYCSNPNPAEVAGSKSNDSDTPSQDFISFAMRAVTLQSRSTAQN